MSIIKHLRETRGLTQARLAELAGTSQPQIRRLEAGERQLTKEWAERLAPHLGLSASDLMFGGDPYDPPSPSGPPYGVHTSPPVMAHNQNRPFPESQEKRSESFMPARGSPAVSDIELQSNMPGAEAGARQPPSNARLGNQLPDQRVSIPLFGQAVGGVDGEFVMNGDRLDDVFAPPSLSAVQGAYAVHVAGESMEPRYFDGEIVFVNPMKRPRRGDFVVAQIKADEHEPVLAYVKRFVRWNAAELVLAQYNPEKELIFTANKVISVHLVIMGGSV